MKNNFYKAINFWNVFLLNLTNKIEEISVKIRYYVQYGRAIVITSYVGTLFYLTVGHD